MLRNYLQITFRNLWLNKFYTLINILGLAVAITAALFIFQYVHFEKSYDNFHEHIDNLYRITGNLTVNGVELPPEHSGLSTFPPAVKRECPEVVEYARLTQLGIDNCVISYEPEDGKQPSEFLVEKVFYTEASFLKMFSFPMLAGEPFKALEAPHSLLLSENLVEKIFGKNWLNIDPVGKVLRINGKENYTINGVFQNIPENSHIKFDALLSLTTLSDDLHYDTEWVSTFPA